MSQPKKLAMPPKKAIILRGVPGSGKSTYASYLHKVKETKIISSDDPFYSMKANRPIYRKGQEYQSHQYCRTSFVIACQANERFIVIDDFNINESDLYFYNTISQYFGYEVELLRLPFRDPPINWRHFTISVCKKMQAELDAQPLKTNERVL